VGVVVAEIIFFKWAKLHQRAKYPHVTVIKTMSCNSRIWKTTNQL